MVLVLVFDYSNGSNAKANRDRDKCHLGTAPKQRERTKLHDVYF